MIGSSEATSTLFLGHNGEWWDSYLIVSLIFAALAAIAVGVTTAGSIISHKREAASAEGALERYKLKTAADISDSQERAAEANERAAVAELNLEKFRRPRKFDTAQKQRITAALSPFSGTPFDMMVTLESEPEGLAAQIGSLLEAAGWVWKDRNNTPGLAINIDKHQAGLFNGGPPLAIEIDISKKDSWSQAVLALGNALTKEGFVPVLNMATDNSASADAIHIYVGSKR
jgi:hypothetical protein